MSQPKHLLVVSCLVRNREQKFLLVRHHIRGWELPQGRVEEGEAVSEGLHREVFEETGVRVEKVQAAVVWSKLSDPAALIFCFTATYASGELIPSEETPDVAWMTEEQALRAISHPVNRDRVMALLEPAEGLRFRSYATNPYRVLS